MPSINLIDRFKASLPNAREALEFAGTALLVAGLVSTFFGQAHLGDAGSSLGNLFYGVGITSAVVGGLVLGASFYKRYLEKHPEKTLPEWYQKLGAICKGAFNSLSDTPKPTLWVKAGACVLFAGALAIALAALHMHLETVGESADVGALILGSVSVIAGSVIIFNKYNVKFSCNIN